jgi:hypothetical protein
MGMAGGAALGLGGGLVGGMLLADAMEDHDQSEYNQGYGKDFRTSMPLQSLTSSRCRPGQRWRRLWWW